MMAVLVVILTLVAVVLALLAVMLTNGITQQGLVDLALLHLLLVLL
jgi:hypothetical protein